MISYSSRRIGRLPQSPAVPLVNGSSMYRPA